MSNQEQTFDIAIIGGGLAGLALAIQCARAGYTTILFEKERYPFHRVCGEYISFESWNFLQELGLPLSDMQLPVLQKLLVSAPKGKTIEERLMPGGFGISRFHLDHQLYKIAKESGVEVKESCKVLDAIFSKDRFRIVTSNKEYNSRIVAGAYGKRSNIDIRWKRGFTKQKPGKLNHYIGVKYHVGGDFPKDVISLHNFENGYCGISAIEDGKYCLCYLTTAQNLRKNKNDLQLLEERVLMKNPHLKKIFSEIIHLYDEPLTISQVSFNRKTQVEQHVLMTGDSAGLITPLCGNGMSMALHSSKIAFEEIDAFLQGNISRFEMELQYAQRWEQQFASRLLTGRILQQFFGSVTGTSILIGVLKMMPGLLRFLIRHTHGKTY